RQNPKLAKLGLAAKIAGLANLPEDRTRLARKHFNILSKNLGGKTRLDRDAALDKALNELATLGTKVNRGALEKILVEKYGIPETTVSSSGVRVKVARLGKLPEDPAQLLEVHENALEKHLGSAAREKGMERDLNAALDKLREHGTRVNVDGLIAALNQYNVPSHLYFENPLIRAKILGLKTLRDERPSFISSLKSMLGNKQAKLPEEGGLKKEERLKIKLDAVVAEVNLHDRVREFAESEHPKTRDFKALLQEIGRHDGLDHLPAGAGGETGGGAVKFNVVSGKKDKNVVFGINLNFRGDFPDLLEHFKEIAENDDAGNRQWFAVLGHKIVGGRGRELAAVNGNEMEILVNPETDLKKVALLLRKSREHFEESKKIAAQESGT
ncbi:MAG: hypothetical protein NTY90_05540, partial [Candidatus Micrarchaeota archaeon]|nr:hypothetical protein [Candidatus Micrarchaeota archaeon]